MDSPNDHLAWMRQQLARHTHKPGWTLTIDPGPTLTIRWTTPDSRNPGQTAAVKSIRPLPATYDPDEFTQAVLAGLDDAERHETREWFRRDGVLVDDPHADPNRWQCCGGTGPKRDSHPTWTCPGCGTTQAAGAA